MHRKVRTFLARFMMCLMVLNVAYGPGIGSELYVHHHDHDHETAADHNEPDHGHTANDMPDPFSFISAIGSVQDDLTIHAKADWDNYCVFCGAGRSDDYLCSGCGGCGGEIEGCTCWCEHHCQGCGACEEEVYICEGCGEHCDDCSDMCENCHKCEDCVGEIVDGLCVECDETACPNCGERGVIVCDDCGAYCNECSGMFCESCNKCEQCVVICSECLKICEECDDGFCEGCNMCSDCNGGTACPDCHSSCLECGKANQCGNCYHCESCATICSGCGDYCTECNDEEWCYGCDLCGPCNGGTACPGCQKTCESCGNEGQCQQCCMCAACAYLCDGCGEICSECDSGWCFNCNNCSSCNGGTACPECGMTCMECEALDQCRNCYICENEATICESCGEACSECGEDTWCYGCDKCGGCNGETACPGCQKTCMECGSEAQCKECFNCAACAVLCEGCGEICSECDDGWCSGCSHCSGCNNDTACPGCHETCLECESKAQCGSCYTCEGCATLCENCGAQCSECDPDGWCNNCNTCGSCNGDSVCPDCHETCLECEAKPQCEDCLLCQGCTDICSECGLKCQNCDDDFCLGCGVCSDCNDDTACPGCHESCLQCNSKAQCGECHLCEDCTTICEGCGAKCSECDSDAWCNNCNLCEDCNGGTVCPGCHETCKECENRKQCNDCLMCEDCATICDSCGEKCSECDGDGFCLNCSTCTDCNGDTTCPDCHQTCENCADKAQCNDCHKCADCTLICEVCGETCHDCEPDGWCDNCNSCAECNNGTACPDCAGTCELCADKVQCPECFRCEDCTLLCNTCNKCEECTTHLCEACHNCAECTEASRVAVNATCTEGGYTAWKCSCGHESQTEGMTAPLGHDWGEWKITKPATETETGVMMRICRTDPTHTETKEIPKGSAEKINVFGVSLSYPAITLVIGDYENLVAYVKPDDATDPMINWTSSDTSIATVNGDGRVVAVAEGTVMVTATAFNGTEDSSDDKSAFCMVTVVKSTEDPSDKNVSGLTLDYTTRLMQVGDETFLTATVKPAVAKDKTVVWSSNDETVATVNASGKITAVGVGTTTIIATATNGTEDTKDDISAVCSVIVFSEPATYINVEGLELDVPERTAAEGEKFTITSKILPADATDKTIVWASSDTKIATVDENGHVTAVSKGQVMIYATATNGTSDKADDYVAVCKLNVEEKTAPDTKTPTLVVDDKGKETVYVNGKVDTSYEGLAMYTDGDGAVSFKYVSEGKVDNDKYAFVDYEGYQFIVANGEIAKVNGLVMDPNSDKWYFCAEGQVCQHTGLVMYNDEWFYVDEGTLDTGLSALVPYNGGLFYVAAGRITREVNGLVLDPNSPDWYFVALGEVQNTYTGLAFYDSRWFYVENGRLAVEYTGTVEYDGQLFSVVSGMVVEQ